MMNNILIYVSVDIMDCDKKFKDIAYIPLMYTPKSTLSSSTLSTLNLTFSTSTAEWPMLICKHKIIAQHTCAVDSIKVDKFYGK